MERERGLGHGQRVTEKGVVVGDARMAEPAAGCATMVQGPVEGADGGVEQLLIARDVVERREARDRPATLAGVEAAIDRRLWAGAALAVIPGVESIARQRRIGIGVQAGNRRSSQRAMSRAVARSAGSCAIS
jgi:hypothetical protein